MARPKTGNAVADVTLSLSKKNLPAARKLAFRLGLSLSEVVDRLLVAEMSSDESIVKQFPRTLEAGK